MSGTIDRRAVVEIAVTSNPLALSAVHDLWNAGKDTYEIGKTLGVPELTAYHMLHRVLYEKRIAKGVGAR
jgi:hypothetical protein